MSRFTPLRTTARTGRTLVRDQRVQRLADIGLGDCGRETACLAEEHERLLAAGRLLVALERRPGAVTVCRNRFWGEHALDDVGGAPRQPQGGEEAQRDRTTVAAGAFRAGLERVRERMAEIERLPRAAVEGIAEADGCLEGRAAANELLVCQLPKRLAGEEACLDDLRHALAPLLVGERLEITRVDHRSHRPMEATDEVLALREVQGSLPADRGIDHPDQRR